ncbi:MAG: hypothetical protein CML68_14655 [Rhodobacteraceae bacterium]|nr:hypothetical protein [Paracoccaceae bacterium]
MVQIGARVRALIEAWRAVVLGLVLLVASGATTSAQQAGAVGPILTIDSERFFVESEFGMRVAADIETASAALARENRRIEGELSHEEQDLTDRRATMEPDEFRILAEEFDTRVQRIRREQEAKARALADRSDAGRVAFLGAARPILGQLLQETGGSVILERGSVFFSSNASDVTDRAIALINAAVGDGAAADAQQGLGLGLDGSAGPAGPGTGSSGASDTQQP